MYIYLSSDWIIALYKQKIILLCWITPAQLYHIACCRKINVDCDHVGDAMFILGRYEDEYALSIRIYQMINNLTCMMMECPARDWPALFEERYKC